MPSRITRSALVTAAEAFAAVLFAASVAAQQPDSVPPHQTFTLQSAVLNETRRINVYTPPDYAQGGRFDVLYMPDGGMEEDFPHVAAAVDAAIRAQEMRPVLVVGIENTERRRDMTGPTTVHTDSAIAPHVGGSAAFRRFIADELMPEIRARYHVTNETAILGESLAGLFIVETYLLEPDLFDRYIALSPSLWWNREEMVRTAGEHLRAHPRSRASLLLSSAGDDIGPEAARLAEALRANAPAGLQWRYVPRPDLRHATIYRGMEARVLREMLPLSPTPGFSTRRLLVSKVEHVSVTAPDAERLFTLFRDSLGLPQVWPFRDYGGFSRGGVSLGNLVLEFVAAPAGSGTAFGAMALEPWDHTREALAELDRRGLAHGAPDSAVVADSTGTPVRGWINTWLTGLVPDSVAFLCDYVDRPGVAAGRQAAADSLARAGGGPLGVRRAKSIDVGVRDPAAAALAWRRLADGPEQQLVNTFYFGRGPSVRLFLADTPGIGKIVIEVRSMARARDFLAAHGLLEPGDAIAIRRSAVGGLRIGITEPVD